MKGPSPHNRPLYNSRIIDSYIRLVKLRYPHVNVADLLRHADMKGYQVADQGHWFTQGQINRFYERLSQLTGNPHIAREAGRFAASPEALGVMRQYVLGLIGASHAFELINKATANFTRSARYESRRLAPNRVEVTVTPLEEGLEQPFQCENRIGFFEAMVMIFNPHSRTASRYAEIEHPECMFRGGSVCRYIVSWKRSSADLRKRIRTVTLLLLACSNLLLVLLGYLPLVETALPASVALAFLAILAAELGEKQEMQASLNHTRDSQENLLNQIDINYNNAIMTSEIGQELGSFTSREEILSQVTRIMERRLDYDRGAIYLVNSEQTRLVMQASYGYTTGQLACLKRLSFHLDRHTPRGVFARAFKEQRHFLVNDLQDTEEGFSPRVLTFARLLDIQSFICCPIVCQGTSLGVLAVDNPHKRRPLLESDMSLLTGIASMIGISLRNSQLIDASLRQFKSLLQVLAASIDARDSLTAGHSEKVTEYSLGICQEVGLASDYCDMIAVAALLHDYGKIGVPDNILKKDGRLTDEEYEVVKMHAARTAEILAKVNFEGLYAQVPEIAGAHHEKIDGSGYPGGLKGTDIPLGARIIAVADYFDSVTSKRHYRDPLPIPEAFALLRKESGTHLDQRLVEALIGYYVRTYT